MPFNNPFEDYFKNKEERPSEKGVQKTDSQIESEPEFPAGEYKVRATFINRKGERTTQNIDFPIRISSPISKNQLDKKAINEVSFLGLHNFGMDIYVERYPDGHPVTIEVINKDDNLVSSLVQIFNASGHPVA